MNNFITEEKEISSKVIDTIRLTINGCTNLQNYSESKIGIIYISTMGLLQPETYIIFLPFFDFYKFESYRNTPYLYIERFTMNVSDVFYKWVFENKTNVIGKITNKKICSWEIFTGDLNMNIIENRISNETENFEEWFEKKINKNNIKLMIKNPMIYRVPFPVKDIEITITNNNFVC
jgi:hypothetical protein